MRDAQDHPHTFHPFCLAFQLGFPTVPNLGDSASLTPEIYDVVASDLDRVDGEIELSFAPQDLFILGGILQSALLADNNIPDSAFSTACVIFRGIQASLFMATKSPTVLAFMEINSTEKKAEKQKSFDKKP
jgi:hypothetical protein